MYAHKISAQKVITFLCQNNFSFLLALYRCVYVADKIRRPQVESVFI